MRACRIPHCFSLVGIVDKLTYALSELILVAPVYNVAGFTVFYKGIKSHTHIKSNGGSTRIQSLKQHHGKTLGDGCQRVAYGAAHFAKQSFMVNSARKINAFRNIKRFRVLFKLGAKIAFAADLQGIVRMLFGDLLPYAKQRVKILVGMQPARRNDLLFHL